jgi:hypothetical protein
LANALRGEATLKIAGCTYTLAITMESLAGLADMLGDPPMHDLYQRLVGASLFTSRAALAGFMLSGTDPTGKELKKRDAAKRAVEDYSLSEAPAVQAAFMTLLAALTRKSDEPAGEEDPGNRTAAQG